MNTTEKSTIYVSKEGELYIKLEGHQCIHGIYKLQMVAPQEIQIDEEWFQQEIRKKSIKELSEINGIIIRLKYYLYYVKNICYKFRFGLEEKINH